ncbi:MAG: NRDE family protein [Rhodospirillaceae bacterium]|nr:NRDE family protein [Rhodospirillaceae bacterium]
MCTVVTLFRPGHRWPLILGANRDEAVTRPWRPPARHWPDRPDVVAGLDELAGGTWMGLNDTGVVACILNRHGTLGPQAGKRSRGELVLEALDHADAAAAAEALAHVDPAAYRPFNMVIADNATAWWLALRQDSRSVAAEPIPAGLSMFTAGDRNDMAERRIAAFLPRFAAAEVPDPEAGRWQPWSDLLGRRAATETPYHGMTFMLDNGFGTSSSSLLAVPSAQAAHDDGLAPVWRFAAGPPDSAPFRPIDLTAPTTRKLSTA